MMRVLRNRWVERLERNPRCKKNYSVRRIGVLSTRQCYGKTLIKSNFTMGTLFFLLALYISKSVADCGCNAPLKVGQFNVGQETFQAYKEERLASTISFISDQTDFGNNT
jgi:hypothetical protein